MPAKAKGRKGKIGKKKGWIAAYYNSGRHHWNKARCIAHHMRRYGEGDKSANEALKVALAALPMHMSRRFMADYNV